MRHNSLRVVTAVGIMTTMGAIAARCGSPLTTQEATQTSLARGTAGPTTSTTPAETSTVSPPDATATALFENTNRKLALNGEPTLAPGSDLAPFTHEACVRLSRFPVQLVGASFITPAEGWIAKRSVGGNELWHTTDAGKRWFRVSALDFDVQHIAFQDTTHGWAVGVRQTCNGVETVDHPIGAVTKDGGQAWSEMEIPGVATDLAVVGTQLRIHTHVCAEPCVRGSRPNYYAEYLSDDDGASWQAVPRPTDTGQPCKKPIPEPGQLYWLDAATGWASCSGSAGPTYLTKQLFYTADGGDTWTLVSEIRRVPPASPPAGVGELPDPAITALLFRNANDGWVGTEEWGTTLLRTHDGGRSWSPVKEEIESAVRSIDFIDASDGFVVTTYSLWRTTNGGDTWQSIRLPLF